MTENRKKELDELTKDKAFLKETYEKLSMPEVYYIMKKAEEYSQELSDENPEKKIFEMKQKWFSSLTAKHIENMEVFYVASFAKTNMPYAYCNMETYDDQVMIFTEEQLLLEAIEVFGKEKIELQVMKVEKQRALNFFFSLFYLGINAVVFNPNTDNMNLQLTQIVKSPAWDKMENKASAVVNSELQLTMMYFMQLYHKPIDMQEKKELPKLEEEMLVNLLKGNYLIVFLKVGENSEVRIPYIKTKANDLFFPIFTDMHELQKYLKMQKLDGNKEIKIEARIWDFEQIRKSIGENVKGIAVNPLGCNLILLKDKIPMIVEKYS